MGMSHTHCLFLLFKYKLSNEQDQADMLTALMILSMQMVKANCAELINMQELNAGDIAVAISYRLPLVTEIKLKKKQKK